MKSCSNCKHRAFNNVGIAELCGGYEMCGDEVEERMTAESCPRYEYGTPDCWECGCVSAADGDYSPAAPWNAPGMSPRDFY